jgi:hypothetical protein
MSRRVVPLLLVLAVTAGRAPSSGLCFGQQPGDARATQVPPGPTEDPLQQEIDRLTSLLHSRSTSDATWAEVKGNAAPALALAAEALRTGRRWLALQRLAVAEEELAARAYVDDRTPGERTQPALFEAEWKRMGGVLRAERVTPAPAALADVQPAALGAVAEAALFQVGVYYDASLEYGRSTMAESGLYYVGVAVAQRDLVALCRRLAARSAGATPPALRSLKPELDALESEVLAAYRPPASIDHHREFIILSATIKEARELDNHGLRRGALLRYLQARARFVPLRPAPPQAAVGLTVRLREAARRIDGSRTDHSLARLFLEQAEADVADAGTTRPPSSAAAILDDVLPHYFAALEPAVPRPASVTPRATVTLVRWPYT